MKKTLLSIFAIASIGAATSQTNLDLEAWTAGTGYDSPDGWITFNQFNSFGIPITVTKETANPGGGTNSAVMTTTLCTACPTLLQMSDTLAGLMMQSFPVSDTNINSVGFKFLYNAVSSDQGIALVEFTKWNGTDNDVVGQGWIPLTSQSNWGTTIMPVVYTGASLPDTMTIIFGSSISVLTEDYTNFPQSQFGSELKVDDIVINTPTGIVELSLDGVTIYTNNNNIVVNSFEIVENTTIEVYNIAGKMVANTKLNFTSKIISTEEMTAGIYLVKVSNVKGIITKKVYVK